MRNKALTRYSSAFTLIELLVVISIVALLASIILLMVTNARLKGRDARLTNDIKQLQNAIETDYNSVGYNYNNAFTVANGAISFRNSGDYPKILADLNAYAPSGYTNSVFPLVNQAAGRLPYDGYEVVVVTDGTVSGNSWLINAANYAIFVRLNNGNYFCLDSGYRSNPRVDPSISLYTYTCP